MTIRNIPYYTVLLSLALNSTMILAECPSNVAGETAHWIIAVCEARAGTDDFENAVVQKCVELETNKYQVKPNAAPSCKLNALYKKEWCGFVVEWKGDTSVTSCMSSPKQIPSIVSDGGAG